MTLPAESFADAIRAARRCQVCADALPHAPRPVFRLATTARILIVGQAPGARVHASGIPWNDPSGDRLRGWLGVDRPTFYDAARIAILPIGLCYPGTVAGADLPPRRECAPEWQARLARHLLHLRLVVLVGSYAQAFHLGRDRGSSMTETVRRYRDFAPGVVPTPHPSWRTTAWQRRNPWFEGELLPHLRALLADALRSA